MNKVNKFWPQVLFIVEMAKSLSWQILTGKVLVEDSEVSFFFSFEEVSVRQFLTVFSKTTLIYHSQE